MAKIPGIFLVFLFCFMEKVLVSNAVELTDERYLHETSEEAVNDDSKTTELAYFPFSILNSIDLIGNFSRKLTFQQSFNVARFRGQWFEIARNIIASSTYEFACKGSKAVYSIGSVTKHTFDPRAPRKDNIPSHALDISPSSSTLVSPLPYINIVNSCTRAGVPTSVSGRGYVVSPQTSTDVFQEGRLLVKFFNENKLPVSCAAFQTEACPGNYWVLWTDYDKLAVIGGPVPFGSVFFLARTPEVKLSDLVYMKMKALEAGVSLLEVLPGALTYTTPEE